MSAPWRMHRARNCDVRPPKFAAGAVGTLKACGQLHMSKQLVSPSMWPVNFCLAVSVFACHCAAMAAAANIST